MVAPAPMRAPSPTNANGPTLASGATLVDDSLWCYPAQDIGISLYYLQYHQDYRELRAAFTRGYESVRPWPETGDGGVDTFIAARCLDLISLVCSTDDPSIAAHLPTMLEKGTQRMATWLAKDGGSG